MVRNRDVRSLLKATEAQRGVTAGQSLHGGHYLLRGILGFSALSSVWLAKDMHSAVTSTSESSGTRSTSTNNGRDRSSPMNDGQTHDAMDQSGGTPAAVSGLNRTLSSSKDVISGPRTRGTHVAIKIVDTSKPGHLDLALNEVAALQQLGAWAGHGCAAPISTAHASYGHQQQTSNASHDMGTSGSKRDADAAAAIAAISAAAASTAERSTPCAQAAGHPAVNNVVMNSSDGGVRAWGPRVCPHIVAGLDLFAHTSRATGHVLSCLVMERLGPSLLQVLSQRRKDATAAAQAATTQPASPQHVKGTHPAHLPTLSTAAEPATALPCLSAPELRALTCQTLEALAHMHERNIVHCDLKPANLCMQHRGTGPGLTRPRTSSHVHVSLDDAVWKLVDFGSAARLIPSPTPGTHASQTQKGHGTAAGHVVTNDEEGAEVLLSLAYTPPEALLGLKSHGHQQQTAVGVHSGNAHAWANHPGHDMWSLACCVYEGATGNKLLDTQRARQALGQFEQVTSMRLPRSENNGTLPIRLSALEDEELHMWLASHILGPIPRQLLARATLASADEYWLPMTTTDGRTREHATDTISPLMRLDLHPAAVALLADTSPSSCQPAAGTWGPLQLLRTYWPWNGGEEGQGQGQGQGGHISSAPVCAAGVVQPLKIRLQGEAAHLAEHERRELEAFLVPLLSWDPEARPTARAALALPWLHTDRQ